jgi:colicin import membrane protein
MGKKKRALFSPKFKVLREGKLFKITKEFNTKMKFISRAKRKALEEKLATLEKFSDEAKAIRGQLGWGEPAPPAPPAPEPVVVVPPAPVPKPKVEKAPVKKAEPAKKKVPAKKKATTKKSAYNKKK